MQRREFIKTTGASSIAVGTTSFMSSSLWAALAKSDFFEIRPTTACVPIFGRHLAGEFISLQLLLGEATMCCSPLK